MSQTCCGDEGSIRILQGAEKEKQRADFSAAHGVVFELFFLIFLLTSGPSKTGM